MVIFLQYSDWTVQELEMFKLIIDEFSEQLVQYLDIILSCGTLGRLIKTNDQIEETQPEISRLFVLNVGEAPKWLCS